MPHGVGCVQVVVAEAASQTAETSRAAAQVAAHAAALRSELTHVARELERSAAQLAREREDAARAAAAAEAAAVARVDELGGAAEAAIVAARCAPAARLLATSGRMHQLRAVSGMSHWQRRAPPSTRGVSFIGVQAGGGGGARAGRGCIWRACHHARQRISGGGARGRR